MELQFSQYQHQSTSVPSTDEVCSALRYRNVDSIGRRHEYTGGFPQYEVSATDTWFMLVDSCLQCRGASATWFVNHWWHLTSLTLISVWPFCTLGPWSTSTWWCMMRLMVDTYEHSKAGEDRWVALATSDSTRFRRMPTLYCYIYDVEIWDRQRSWRGATVHLDYATTTIMMTMNDDFSDVVLKTRVLVSRRLEDKNESLGLGLGLGLEENVLQFSRLLL